MLVLLGDTGIHRSAMIADRKMPVVETDVILKKGIIDET